MIEKLNTYFPKIANLYYANKIPSKNVSFGAVVPAWQNPCDTFTQNPINKLKNFSIEEYKQLTIEEISQINELIKKANIPNLDTDLRYHDRVALKIQETLNSKYGEDNYVVIPIGRSLSSIGKKLSYKIGEDNVKNLPMSQGFRFTSRRYINTCEEDFDALIKYLKSIGLSKEEIETSGKTYILTDYCCTGQSLHGTEKLLKSKKVFGNQANIVSIDILGLIDKTRSNLNVINELKQIIYCIFSGRRYFEQNLVNLLSANTFKCYSLVDKCDNLSKSSDAVIKPEQYSQEAKFFFFKLLDSEMNNTNAS